MHIFETLRKGPIMIKSLNFQVPLQKKQKQTFSNRQMKNCLRTQYSVKPRKISVDRMWSYGSTHSRSRVVILIPQPLHTREKSMVLTE